VVVQDWQEYEYPQQQFEVPAVPLLQEQFIVSAVAGTAGLPGDAFPQAQLESL
jgi:hypothetical protein